MKYVSPIITILALLLSSIGCLSAARCPFPGIPARASAWTDNGIYKNEVVWKRGTYFTEGHRIEYECKNGWQIPMSEQMSIQCQEDGTWTAKIPRCGKLSLISNCLCPLPFFIILCRPSDRLDPREPVQQC